MKHINRDKYLQELVSLRGNGMIKIITGMRRCGKSYLLFNIFGTYLLQHQTGEDHIIRIDFEDYDNFSLRQANELSRYVKSKITDDKEYYLLFDEVQHLENFDQVLGGFLKIPNVEIYVTGSNAKFLSRDVITEFRGRGFEVRVYPLNFREYMSAYDGDEKAALNHYMIYGSLPQILGIEKEEHKIQFLQSLLSETYLRDIKERYKIEKDADLEEVINILASDIGSLTNPNKLADTFRSVKRTNISYDTIKNYIDLLADSFLLEKSMRFDLKGRRYINSPYKYYFSDLGLRNARINFRQTERSHLVENLLYNDLRSRGFSVDVGAVPIVYRDNDGKQIRKTLEVDFVCNRGSQRYYIQSAYEMLTQEKIDQECASLRKINDSFKKIIITTEQTPVIRDEKGITTVSIYDFLRSENPLEV